MKRLVRFVVVILVIGAIALCVYRYRVELGLVHPATSQESANSEQPSSGLHPAHIVWQALDRSPDGFKVEMPAGTRQTQIPAFDERGNVDQVDMIYAYPDSQTTFAVPGPTTPRWNEPAATVRTERWIWPGTAPWPGPRLPLPVNPADQRDGFPARDFSGRNEGGGIFNARMILAGRRLYMLIAAFPASSARSDEDVNRFFDSFSLTSAARND